MTVTAGAILAFVVTFLTSLLVTLLAATPSRAEQPMALHQAPNVPPALELPKLPPVKPAVPPEAPRPKRIFRAVPRAKPVFRRAPAPGEVRQIKAEGFRPRCRICGRPKDGDHLH